MTVRFKLSGDVDLRKIAEICPKSLTGADFYALCSDALLAGEKSNRNCIKKNSYHRQNQWDGTVSRFRNNHTRRTDCTATTLWAGFEGTLCVYIVESLSGWVHLCPLKNSFGTSRYFSHWNCLLECLISCRFNLPLSSPSRNKCALVCKWIILCLVVVGNYRNWILCAVLIYVQKIVDWIVCASGDYLVQSGELPHLPRLQVAFWRFAALHWKSLVRFVSPFKWKIIQKHRNHRSICLKCT